MFNFDDPFETLDRRSRVATIEKPGVRCQHIIAKPAGSVPAPGPKELNNALLIAEEITDRGLNPLALKNSKETAQGVGRKSLGSMLSLRAGTLEPSRFFGWTGSDAEDRDPDTAMLKDAKVQWEASEAPILTLSFAGYEQGDAKSALVLAYGEDFFEHIQRRGSLAFNEGLDMAYAVYDPAENAAFFLSRYDRDPEGGAKIFFDAKGHFDRIESKGGGNPFKNAGEYFATMLRHAKKGSESSR